MLYKYSYYMCVLRPAGVDWLLIIILLFKEEHPQPTLYIQTKDCVKVF
jgi:hypothetical protein